MCKTWLLPEVKPGATAATISMNNSVKTMAALRGMRFLPKGFRARPTGGTEPGRPDGFWSEHAGRLLDCLQAGMTSSALRRSSAAAGALLGAR